MSLNCDLGGRMLPMAALTALAVRSEPFTLPTACGGVLFAGRFVAANVLSCLQGVSVKVDHLSDPS